VTQSTVTIHRQLMKSEILKKILYTGTSKKIGQMLSEKIGQMSQNYDCPRPMLFSRQNVRSNGKTMSMVKVYFGYTSRDSTLQDTARHCKTLQRTATHCNALQHTAVHWIHIASRDSTLQDTARHCKTLQRTATHCNALQRAATRCNTLQYTGYTLHRVTAHCKTLQPLQPLQRTATHCNTLQYTEYALHRDMAAIPWLALYASTETRRESTTKKRGEILHTRRDSKIKQRRETSDTGWRRSIGCLIVIGQFSAKEPYN